MPESFSSIDVRWFVYGLAIAGRYNTMVDDESILEDLKDDVQFGDLLLGTESSSGGDSA